MEIYTYLYTKKRLKNDYNFFKMLVVAFGKCFYNNISPKSDIVRFILCYMKKGMVNVIYEMLCYSSDHIN
jgi:hypothetical protein